MIQDEFPKGTRVVIKKGYGFWNLDRGYPYFRRAQEDTYGAVDIVSENGHIYINLDHGGRVATTTGSGFGKVVTDEKE